MQTEQQFHNPGMQEALEEFKRKKTDAYSELSEGAVDAANEERFQRISRRDKKPKNEQPKVDAATPTPDVDVPPAPKFDMRFAKDVAEGLQELRDNKTEQPASKPEDRYKNPDTLWVIYNSKDTTAGEKIHAANLLLKHFEFMLAGTDDKEEVQARIQELSQFIRLHNARMAKPDEQKKVDEYKKAEEQRANLVKEKFESENPVEGTQIDGEHHEENVEMAMNMINRAEWHAKGTPQNLGEKRENVEEIKAGLEAMWANQVWVTLSGKEWDPTKIEEFIKTNRNSAGEKMYLKLKDNK